MSILDRFVPQELDEHGELVVEDWTDEEPVAHTDTVAENPNDENPLQDKEANVDA